MARIAYFDCFSGVSGDMMLGALLDAGLPLDDLRRALGSLTIEGYEIGAERVSRAGVAATKFRVFEREHEASHAYDHVQSRADDHGHEHGHDRSHDREPDRPPEGPPFSHAHVGHAHAPDHGRSHAQPHAHHEHRTLAEINALIDRSALSSAGRQRAKDLFRRLGEAEAAIHQMPIERVHLHEVGALDSIIDIVGAVFALEWLQADRIVASPLNVGGGMVRSAHGLFPVPAPATVRLLAGAPIYSSGLQAELVTPTGALLVTGYATAFGPVPPMTVATVGYGAGERDLEETPNVFRVLIGDDASPSGAERVTVIECEIDDMNPQIFGVLMDRLYAAGALEVFYAGVQMKKGRPGTLVTIIAPPDRREALSAVVFRETTTIGLRYTDVNRERLERELVTIETPLGAVRFKVARRAGAIVNAAPEFDDCVRLASERGLSVKDVQAVAVKAYLDRHVQ